jgi:ABC-type branched-subunit amino acid transport system ATPase component/branched-subunit amino acid ABC-type transport system permease component
MTAFFQFALLGLGAGAAYTLLGTGAVLIYRGSGVVNFAQAAMALVGALLFYSMADSSGVPVVVAFLVAVIIVGLLGALFFLAVMRPLGTGAPFARTVATLGLLILLQGVASLIWGVIPLDVTPYLSQSLIHLGSVVLSADRLILFGIAGVLSLAIAAWGRYSATGLALRALAENPRAASTLGWSPIKLGTFTWAAGALLAAAGGILVAPLSGVSTSDMPLLIIPVLAAMLLGDFKPLPLFLAGTAIGIGQSLITNYVSLNGAADSLPFLVIVLYLVIRGTGVTSRSKVVERLPALGSGRINWLALAAFSAVALVILSSVTSGNLLAALVVTLAWAMIGLSVVVVMGYTGQLSLAQFALAGIAALTAARLVSGTAIPLLLCVLIAMAASVGVGVVFALPALRARGTNLAIVTLGLANVTSELIFNNATFSGSFGSISIPSLNLFGLAIDPLFHQTRYAIAVLVLFLLSVLVVASVRRGSAGGRLIAVRTNERAAAALGIGVRGAKLFAFGLGAAIAGLGGIALAFNNSAVDITGFAPLESVYAVAYGVVGGAGYIVGAPGGAQLAPGGFGSWLLDEIAPGASSVWLQVLAGVTLIGLVLVQPDGMAHDWVRTARRLTTRFPWPARLTRRGHQDSPQHGREGQPDAVDVTSATLTVEHLTVRFGGVAAVDDVSLEARPGEVLALIGPNGAGKSTIVDAITGFVRSSGLIAINGEPLGGMAAHRRVGRGLSRSFQSLELFESLTVMDNLLVGADDRRTLNYYRDLVRPRKAELGPLVQLAVREFGLSDVLGTRVEELPYGQRRLVAVARSLATEPSILLLDEPAAGLGEVETREFERVVRLLCSEGVAILLIEHDMRFVMNVSDRIVVLEAGRWLAEGVPDEIRSDGAVIEAYLGQGTQFAVSEPTPGQAGVKEASQ